MARYDVGHSVYLLVCLEEKKAHAILPGTRRTVRDAGSAQKVAELGGKRPSMIGD